MLYAAQSQFDKARAALEVAVRANPSYAIAHENLGDVYARLAAQSLTARRSSSTPRNTSVPPKLALIRQLFTPAAKANWLRLQLCHPPRGPPRRYHADLRRFLQRSDSA